MSWDEREDEMAIPCPVCLEEYKCAPDCDEIVKAWMEEDEAKEKMSKTLADMTTEERAKYAGMEATDE